MKCVTPFKIHQSAVSVALIFNRVSGNSGQLESAWLSKKSSADLIFCWCYRPLILAAASCQLRAFSRYVFVHNWRSCLRQLEIRWALTRRGSSHTVYLNDFSFRNFISSILATAKAWHRRVPWRHALFS